MLRTLPKRPQRRLRSITRRFFIQRSGYMRPSGQRGCNWSIT